MPNHLHGIIVMTTDDMNVGTTHASALDPSLGVVVGAFKSAATKRINEQRGTSGSALWQRNYYEHVIRDEAFLNRIRQYIADNPARWPYDLENPDAVPDEFCDRW